MYAPRPIRSDCAAMSVLMPTMIRQLRNAFQGYLGTVLRGF